MAVEYFHIKERDFDLVEQLISLESAEYDDGGLDTFDLIAMLRHGRVYVAVEFDEILGSVSFMRSFEDNARAFLHNINIIDAQAHPNLAVSLIKIAFSDMKASGLVSVEVNVDPSNYRALKIYREQLGFEPAEEIAGEDLNGEEILILRKEL